MSRRSFGIFNRPSRDSDLQCRDNPLETSDLTLHIFHHESADIQSATWNITGDRRVEFVNLDKLPLPNDLTINGLPDNLTRAALGEYLGLMLIKPTRKMVACFPYTLPYKFSYAWARYSQSRHTFLPQFDFLDILKTRYRTNYLYAAELGNPTRHYPDFLEHIKQKFMIADDQRSDRGPLKGSLIVSREEFLLFQKWLRSVAAHLISNFDLTTFPEVSSLYSGGPMANRSDADKRRDPVRHGLGNVLERATAYYFAHRFDPQHMKKLGAHVQLSRNVPDLQTMLARHARARTIYIVFGNSAYSEIVENWIVATQTQKIFNFIVIALDKSLYRRLTKAGVPTILEPCSHNLSDLWIRRVKLLHKIVALGFSVIHSDADAVILKDPEQHIDLPDSDFVFTQGTIWPPETYEKWGFVLCCGFFKVNATEKAKSILRSIETDVRKTQDDQVSFNRILGREISTFDSSNSRYFDFNGRSVRWAPETMTAASPCITVSILPHNSFQRIHTPEHSAVVKHIYSPKKSVRTKETLIKSGCWVLPSKTSMRRKLAEFLLLRQALNSLRSSKLFHKLRSS